MTSARDMAAAARLRIDEAAALELLDRAHPDWPACTGDDDRCRCSYHEFRRLRSLNAHGAICRQEDIEWLRQAIADTALLIQKLMARSAFHPAIASQVQLLADLKCELKEKLHAKRR